MSRHSEDVDLRLKSTSNFVIVDASTGAETAVDMTELAALNNLGATDLAKIDGITNGTAYADKAVVLNASKGISTITSATITTLTSSTVNATAIATTTPITYKATGAITAFASGGQASATALTGELNNVSVCATAGDSVKLPAAVAGLSIKVRNSGAALLAVFPATGETINSRSANISVNVPVGGEIEFNSVATGAWGTRTILSIPSPTAAKGDLVIQSANNAAEYTVKVVNASHGQASTHTIPDPGGATASFVITEGAQTVNGVKTFANGITLNSGSTLTASGAIVQAPVFVPDATPYTVLAANSGKLHIILEQTSSITLNLPVIAAGLSYKFVMGGVATEAQNWVIVATTPSFYNGGVTWDDSNAVASPVPVYGNGSSHLTLTATTPEAGTAIEIYSDGTEWFVCGAVFSAATPAFT